MPYFIQEKTVNLSEEELRNKIFEEAQKYLRNTFDEVNELSFFILKSVAYVEDIISDINKKMHGTSEYTTLKTHLRLLRLVDDETVNKSVDLLEKIKYFRNQIAHNIEYNPKKDSKLLKLFNILHTDSKIDQQIKIAEYFKNTIHGFLYLKLVIDHGASGNKIIFKLK